MLIGERETRLLRRKFKEKHRDRVKEREMAVQTEEEGGEEGGDEAQYQQDRAGEASESFFYKYLCPHKNEQRILRETSQRLHSRDLLDRESGYLAESQLVKPSLCPLLLCVITQ